MSTITSEQLKKEISDILKDADLASMSTKKVREQLEKTFKCDLNSRRGEIKDIVLDFVNSRESDDEDSASSESEADEVEVEEEAPKGKKRASSGRKPTPAKKKKKASSDEEANSEADGNSEDEDSDAKPKKRAAKGRKKAGRKKKGSGSDSDEEWKQPKQPKKDKGSGKGRGTGFTRPYTLSSDLASIVGAESLPRYEVVKKIWALIKERNLYDPKNKQFAICDSELLKVIGVKRFRTFSMLKYLKPHFID